MRERERITKKESNNNIHTIERSNAKCESIITERDGNRECEKSINDRQEEEKQEKADKDIQIIYASCSRCEIKY